MVPNYFGSTAILKLLIAHSIIDLLSEFTAELSHWVASITLSIGEEKVNETSFTSHRQSVDIDGASIGQGRMEPE